MNKKLKIIFFGIAAMAIAASLFLRQNNDAVSAAQSLVNSIKSGSIDRAYSKLSDALKATATENDMQQFIEQNQLITAGFGDWRTIDKNDAREVLSTSYSNESGLEKPLVAVFGNTDNGWKLDAMLIPETLSGDRLRAETPDMAQLVELASGAVNRFAAAIKSGRIDGFYNATAKLWRDQTSSAELQQAFGAFFQSNLDLTVLSSIKPVIDGTPVQNDKGAITISGFYPTRPSKLSFEQRFIWEGLAWKLVGFTANVN